MEENQHDKQPYGRINTLLAYNRTRAASERTLMAWVRTSLAMISFGFSISTFFRSLRQAEGLPPLRFSSEPLVLGLGLVVLGTVVLALGAMQEYRFMREAREAMKPMNVPGVWTFSFGAAALMILLDLTVLVYLLYRALRTF